MDTIKFNCVVGSTNFAVPLGLEIWLDQHKLFDQDHIDQDYNIEHEISDDDGDHELRFVLKHKQSDHTQVDADGNITKSFKKSKQGRLKLVKNDDGTYRTVTSMDDDFDTVKDELVEVFRMGDLLKEWTFEEVRERAKLSS